jgi:hypothetical protein
VLIGAIIAGGDPIMGLLLQDLCRWRPSSYDKAGDQEKNASDTAAEQNSSHESGVTPLIRRDPNQPNRYPQQ